MTNRKYHWAIQVVPSMHPHAWRAHAGGYYAQACGRRKKSAVGYPAERFVAKSQRNPDWYCSDCARAARLVLAKESAPKPDTRTDSDRYAELRKLVEAWQAKREDALLIGGTEPQSLTDAANDLATWRHR